MMKTAALCYQAARSRDKPNVTAQRTLRESLAALLVLALIFLNFGHVTAVAGPMAFEVGDGPFLSFCGDFHDDQNSAGHSPCHACRIGAGADLPAPVCVAEPSSHAAEIIWLAASADPFFDFAYRYAAPRGPPLI